MQCLFLGIFDNLNLFVSRVFLNGIERGLAGLSVDCDVEDSFHI